MKDVIETYIQAVSKKFTHETTSEYGYRTEFENMLRDVFASIKVSRFDHDAKAKGGNKPDFAVVKNDIPLLYIETKDIGISLDKVEKSEQMSRYYGYANLVLTDYLEFRFYRNGEPYGKPITVANYDVKSRTLDPIPANYQLLANTLLDFTQSHKEPIKSGLHLAKVMAGKAQRIRDNLREFLKTDTDKNNELIKVFNTIKKLLVHDLDKDDFSDMYAQTLVYGLFVARFYDESEETFSRQEARDLIPKSNPLLRHFFDHIVGPNFDKRLEYIVDELCEVFTHADIEKLMEDYYKKDDSKKGPDPVIHFYEDFLKEYDPALRKRMGAYYTPLPVVEFITRSVDEILKKDFGLFGGLADTTKTKDGIHKVQVLDPAVGTGTFYSAVIGEIYKKFKGQKGRWPTYVHNELLPRIHGFELMMAPYTIAHLKLALAFKKTGFKYFNNRLNLFLTNSLENETNQGELFTAFGFADSIAQESKEATKIKNETPIMVVLGNPPYSVSSSNKGNWIQNLIKVYKENLNERKINLDDDYIKFIRFAEHFIEKSGSGIVAMITNNSFIDGITHRQMRKHLLETFDDIYILDLHGDSKRDSDENVFDIQQGVSINIFVRREGEKKGLGKVHHADLNGKRKFKFKELNMNDFKLTNKCNEIEYSAPYYFFVPKDFSLENTYNKGFGLKEIFLKWSTGIETQNDKLLLGFRKDELCSVFKDIVEGRLSKPNLERYLSLSGIVESKFVKLMQKPFDNRWTYLDNKVLGRSRLPFTSNLLANNYALLSTRQYTNKEQIGAFIVATPAGHKSFSANDKTVLFPLHLFNGDGTKTSNLKQEIVDEIEEITGKTTPEDIFDFIYAVLHSPKYREKYKEFLKIDFPRVPYPKNKEVFKKLVKLGRELRELHLLESSKANKFITTYPNTGNDTVEKPAYKDGNVYINEKQYFGKVPEVAWNFWIGGYQPAQKWLKDRKGRKLNNEDIEHYQRMIVALNETDKTMKKIDKVWGK